MCQSARPTARAPRPRQHADCGRPTMRLSGSASRSRTCSPARRGLARRVSYDEGGPAGRTPAPATSEEIPTEGGGDVPESRFHVEEQARLRRIPGNNGGTSTSAVSEPIIKPATTHGHVPAEHASKPGAHHRSSSTEAPSPGRAPQRSPSAGALDIPQACAQRDASSSGHNLRIRISFPVRRMSISIVCHCTT